MRPALTLALLIAAAASPTLAETVYPVKIAAPGGEVTIPSARHQQEYDEFHYAPARRVGDMVYLSGIVAGPVNDEATDAAGFELQMRRAFKHLDMVLKAAGTSWDDVVSVNSFHVWESPDVKVTRFEQIEIINKVKADYVKGAQPAWTAVGTTGLVAPRGVVELQLVARVPAKS